jgi:hypothetical protein
VMESPRRTVGLNTLNVLAGDTAGNVHRLLSAQPGIQTVNYQNGRHETRESCLYRIGPAESDAVFDVNGGLAPAPGNAPVFTATQIPQLHPVIYDNDERCWLIIKEIGLIEAKQIFRSCKEVQVIRRKSTGEEIWRSDVMKKKNRRNSNPDTGEWVTYVTPAPLANIPVSVPDHERLRRMFNNDPTPRSE